MLTILREGIFLHMVKAFACLLVALSITYPSLAQSPRLWVLSEPNSVIEYDPATFARKELVKVPDEVAKSARIFQINHKGQMLYAPNSDDPSPDVGKGGDKFWLWDGHAASSLGRETIRISSQAGSNQKVSEASPWPFLSADGTHLFWFSNLYNKLERENVELTVTTTFRAWRSDLASKDKQELATFDFAECRCATGACTETCPEARFWVPDGGVEDYFFLTRVIQGQTETKYLSSTLYKQSDATWNGTELVQPLQPLQRVLDLADGGAIVISAILDVGCCGWENQSNDQTILTNHGRIVTLFDERAQFKNPDYDVSFFTENAKLAPGNAHVAMTIEASAKSSAPIQLAEQGQANPGESAGIRRALTDMPAVEVVSAADASKRSAYLPHSYFVGWISEKEILLVENHVLVAYNITTATRRRSTIKVADPSFVFVR